jgi:Protein of unknown function (DUF559)
VERATQLARRQFGAIARRQLLACGFSAERVKSWVRSGRLHPRYPGVFALGRRELGTEGELAAALLVAGPGAALGGLSALWWMELLGSRPRRIHVDAPRRCTPRRGLVCREVAPFRRIWHRDLPVVPFPQALLTSTPHLNHNSLRLVLARAEFRRVLDRPALYAALGSGRHGSTAVRKALAAHLPQLAACANQFEIDFVLLCERYGIPIPQPNVRIGRWRPDMLWRDAKLIVELDGEDAHSTAAQKAADERRAEELRQLGYIVIRFTWDDVHLEPDAVAADLRARLG